MGTVNISKVISKNEIGFREKMELVVKLSVPAILAELTSIAMQYIDAAMVGKLGSDAMASIGLVSTSTWLVGGTCIGAAAGFSVQVAQLIGAHKSKEASNVMRQSLLVLIFFRIISGNPRFFKCRDESARPIYM